MADLKDQNCAFARFLCDNKSTLTNPSPAKTYVLVTATNDK